MAQIEESNSRPDLIIDSFFRFGSSFRQPNPINIGSGFGSQ